MSAETDDFELVERWRQGDPAAGDLLARRHYESVLRFFEGRVPAVAQDLTQRTFLACVESLDRTQIHTSFRAFLFGVARNYLLRHIRDQGRSDRRRDFSESPSRLQIPVTSPSGLFARSQEQHFLLRALTELPVDMQLTVQLRYWENLSSQEIGEAMGITPSAVRTRLARARDQLAEQIHKMQLAPGVHASLLGDLEGWARSVAVRDAPRG
jgi:RNA polymerase sigma-70 factor (ECF subfamily)